VKTGKLIYAASQKDSNLLYASEFSAGDPFIYFSYGNRECILVSPQAYSRALKEAEEGVKVYGLEEFKIDSKKDITEKRLLEITRRFPCDKWNIPNDFPYKLGEYLRKAKVKLECDNDAFSKKRRTKSPEEIKKIIQTQRINEKGMKRAVEILKSSRIRKDGKLEFNKKILTSEILISEIETEIKRFGGNALHTIASCGKDASEPHNSGSGPVYAGKSIVIDIFPKGSNGYFGDMTRTFVKGKAPEIVKKAFDVVKKARDEAEKKIKAGVKGSAVFKVAADIIRKNGFETTHENGIHKGFFHGLGHGVGLDVHEAPAMSAGGELRLKAGDIVTVEPGVYYPEWGGVRLEDMVVVEKNGCRLITKFPTFLEIK